MATDPAPPLYRQDAPDQVDFYRETKEVCHILAAVDTREMDWGSGAVHVVIVGDRVLRVQRLI